MQCLNHPGGTNIYFMYYLHKTTGFSPFELQCGRQARSPLSILKENWEEPEETSTLVMSNLLETRERIKQCSELARMNEQRAKRKV